MNAIEDRTLAKQNQFLHLMDSLPLMLCKLNTDRKGIYFNKEWLSFTGRSLDDLLGDGWLSAIHSKDRSRCTEAFAMANELHEPLRVEHRMHRYDGHQHPVLNTVVPQYSDRGLFSGYISAVLAVHNQASAGAASAKGPERRQIEDGGSAGNIAVVDCAGRIAKVNEFWLRFARGNKATRKAGGTGALYLDACRAAMGLAQTDASASWEGILGVLDGSLSEFRTEYRCPVGHEARWFEMTVHPVRRPEGGAIISHLDITRSREAELQRDALLQELSHNGGPAPVGELVRSLVFQLIGPLNSTLDKARALKSSVSQNGAATTIEDSLSDIITEELQAARMARHLRLLLQRDHGRFTLLNVNRLVRAAAGALRDEAEARDIKISIFPDPELPRVQGQRFQLKLIVLNLILNAFRALAPADAASRRLAIRTCMVGKSQVAIVVGDSSRDIPAHQPGYIFESLTAKEAEPPGSGLALCRSIVKAHHGEISIAKHHDKRMAFRLVLPASARPGP